MLFKVCISNHILIVYWAHDHHVYITAGFESHCWRGGNQLFSDSMFQVWDQYLAEIRHQYLCLVKLWCTYICCHPAGCLTNSSCTTNTYSRLFLLPLNSCLQTNILIDYRWRGTCLWIVSRDRSGTECQNAKPRTWPSTSESIFLLTIPPSLRKRTLPFPSNILGHLLISSRTHSHKSLTCGPEVRFWWVVVV